MTERFQAYFETLEGLSSEELDRGDCAPPRGRAEKLALEEKRNVALLIAHIAEISRRKAELECDGESRSAAQAEEPLRLLPAAPGPERGLDRAEDQGWRTSPGASPRSSPRSPRTA